MSEFAGTDQYEVLRRIGAGGMGVVYEARDRATGARVALKTLNVAEPQAIYRFKNEFRSLSHLEHRNLVSLGELCEDEGRWFFTMEYVEGSDLLTWVAPDRAPAEDAPTAQDWAFQETAVPAAGSGPPRPRASFDDLRLRDAFRQLGQGLYALHQAGKVHRDVKPSNVLVGRDARVVLLDFGLVAESRDGARSTDANVVGTAAYMAPEQAASKPVGPAADLYAAGVVLYEALTGMLPHRGTPLEILMAKQHEVPPPPSELCDGVPADLDELCAALLRIDPDRRATVDAILAMTGDAPSPSLVAAQGSLPTQTPPFVGRADELERIRHAYDAAGEGACVAVWIQGESGVGKSALLRQFTGALDAETVVLTGRCFEREAVPYKGFDGVIDSLSRHLRRLRPAAADALMPRGAGLLSRVFPVLGRVESIARSKPPNVSQDHPQQVRRRTFAALRELFHRIAERKRLVIAIDDWQWADDESDVLLSDLTDGAEPPAALFVLTTRETPPRAATRDTRLIGLERLDEASAATLAAQLLDRAGAAHRVDAESIVREAGGHPLYIDELVRHAAVIDGDGGRPLLLEDAIWQRVRQLPEDARRVLEVACVAGAPIAQATLATAARMDGSDFDRHVSLLRVSSLVRYTRTRGVNLLVEPYHDRVRAALDAQMDAASRRAVHARLALALEMAPEGTHRPEQLVRHLELAGETERAASYASSAARRAADALAFDRAAALFRTAMRLSKDGDVHGLRVELADVLANGGRCADAAELYVRAAEHAGEADAIELKRRAAESFLRSGHIERGIEALRDVLGAVGLRYPETTRRAALTWLIGRARARLRGLRFRERDPSRVTPRELRRVDVCWTAALGLGMCDTLRAAAFQSQHLLLALKAGDRSHVARALGIESAFAANTGRFAQAEAVIERAIAWSKELDDPVVHAWAVGGRALLEYQVGRFERAYRASVESEQALKGLLGEVWEVTSVRMYGLWSQFYLGQLDALADRVPALLREARDRGDLYTVTNLCTGPTNAMWLVNGDTDVALAAVDEVMAQWPSDTYLLQHYWAFFARAHVALYEGDGARAAALTEAAWPALQKSAVPHVSIARIESRYLRGRCAATAAANATGDERTRLLATARREAKRIRKEHFAFSVALSHVIEAGVARVLGRDTDAADLLRRALPHLDEAHLAIIAAATRLRLGAVLGGSEGEAFTGEGRAALASRGLAEPERIAAMFVP